MGSSVPAIPGPTVPAIPLPTVGSPQPPSSSMANHGDEFIGSPPLLEIKQEVIPVRSLNSPDIPSELPNNIR